mmetsp:Transcript_1049/g.3266  ORF Transcript_1049/g.3266 Transcript_1049/m.3266 type:complete len:219 (+) Transcript_1049:313-969(+)
MVHQLPHCLPRPRRHRPRLHRLCAAVGALQVGQLVAPSVEAAEEEPSLMAQNHLLYPLATMLEAPCRLTPRGRGEGQGSSLPSLLHLADISAVDDEAPQQEQHLVLPPCVSSALIQRDLAAQLLPRVDSIEPFLHVQVEHAVGLSQDELLDRLHLVDGLPGILAPDDEVGPQALSFQPVAHRYALLPVDAQASRLLHPADQDVPAAPEQPLPVALGDF